MAVASLVLGVLSFIMFSWLGPFLGVGWATQATIESFTRAEQIGQTPQIVTWPLWLLGLLVGVGIPLLAVILGSVAIAKDQSKGVAIGGLVTGILGAISGFIFIFIFQAFASFGQAALSGDTIDPAQFQQQMNDLQQKLNDPAVQQQFQQRLHQAMGQQPQPMQPQPMQPQPMQPQPMQPQPMQPQPMQPQPVQPQPVQPQPVQPQPVPPQQ